MKENISLQTSAKDPVPFFSIDTLLVIRGEFERFDVIRIFKGYQQAE